MSFAFFPQCGQIVGFRMVYDRETGRPKGFGFCEFLEVHQAELAIRNFNGHELKGRPLRVDSASGNDRGGDDEVIFIFVHFSNIHI